MIENKLEDIIKCLLLTLNVDLIICNEFYGLLLNKYNIGETLNIVLMVDPKLELDNQILYDKNMNVLVDLSKYNLL